MPRVRLNSAAVGSIAKSAEVRSRIERVVNEVADNVRALGIKVGDRDGGPREYDLPVKVRVSVSDRVRASVTLAHPAGIAVQAKHGALTKAASQAGLEVHG